MKKKNKQQGREGSNLISPVTDWPLISTDNHKEIMCEKKLSIKESNVSNNEAACVSFNMEMKILKSTCSKATLK